MFKIVATIVFFIAGGNQSATIYRELNPQTFPAYRDCVAYFDTHGLSVGWKLRAPAAAVRADGGVIQSVQISCRPT